MGSSSRAERDSVRSFALSKAITWTDVVNFHWLGLLHSRWCEKYLQKSKRDMSFENNFSKIYFLF